MSQSIMQAAGVIPTDCPAHAIFKMLRFMETRLDAQITGDDSVEWILESFTVEELATVKLFVRSFRPEVTTI